MKPPKHNTPSWTREQQGVMNRISLDFKDARRLDWLDEREGRMEDVRWYMINERVKLREAIDALAEWPQ